MKRFSFSLEIGSRVQLGTNSTPAPPDTEILSSGFWDDDGIWNDENPDILNTAQ